MIGIIYFKKSGLYTRSFKRYKKIDRPISYYMCHIPKFEKGFTVGDLMQILKEYENDVNLIFLAYTRGFELQPFYEEMNLPLEKEPEKSMQYLEFAWSVQINNFNDFGKSKYEIEEYVQISGKKEGEKESYSIGFTSLNALKESTFRLINKIEYSTIHFSEIWEEKKYRKEVFLKGIKTFTFENIVGAFLNEITYFGYPNQRIVESDKLDEIHENLDSSELIPMEEIQLKWKEKDLAALKKKKETKLTFLKIEKVEKEIAFLRKQLKK